MGTKIYGASDDLIEADGDVSGEVGSFGADDEEHSCLLFCSDGTLLQVIYGRADLAVWEFRVIQKGALLDEVVICEDEDADPHSDQVFFKDGLKWIYVAKDWERMQ